MCSNRTAQRTVFKSTPLSLCPTTSTSFLRPQKTSPSKKRYSSSRRLLFPTQKQTRGLAGKLQRTTHQRRNRFHTAPNLHRVKSTSYPLGCSSDGVPFLQRLSTQRHRPCTSPSSVVEDGKPPAFRPCSCPCLCRCLGGSAGL